MANSTTNLRTVTATQSSKEVTINAMLDAASPSTFGAYDAIGSSGLTWAYLGGTYMYGGTISQLNNGSIALSGSSTNYVEFNPATGAVSKNTTGFTAGQMPLYTVVAGTSTLTSYTDHRMTPLAQNVAQRGAISFGTDANKTLTAAEARCSFMDLTSGVSLTATRNLVVPLTLGMTAVKNGTTGSQSVQVIGASGTGITIANGKTAIVIGDGTNIIRVTADNP